MAKAKKNKKGKNSLAFPIGIIASILAVIGLITVITFALNTAKNITEKTSEKQKHENFLKPVVMFDPDPFDDLTQADVSQLLNSAVWSLLMSENGDSKYSYSEGENFGILVPQKDIENHFNYLFGNEIDIASMHSSIDMSEYDIIYDAAQQSYILPITGVESAYTPKVYSMEKQGSSVILNVGYIGNKAWVQIADGEYKAPEPDKYMKITLRVRSGDEFYVSSIQAVDEQEIIGTTEKITVPETEESTLPPVETTLPEIPAEPVPETDENGEIITTGAVSEEETTVEETEE